MKVDHVRFSDGLRALFLKAQSTFIISITIIYQLIAKSVRGSLTFSAPWEKVAYLCHYWHRCDTKLWTRNSPYCLGRNCTGVQIPLSDLLLLFSITVGPFDHSDIISRRVRLTSLTEERLTLYIAAKTVLRKDWPYTRQRRQYWEKTDLIHGSAERTEKRLTLYMAALTELEKDWPYT